MAMGPQTTRAVVAFFVSAGTESSETVNGVIVACSSTNYVGFIAAAALVVLAVVHLLRGFGVIGGAC